jgi:hypothetical protein
MVAATSNLAPTMKIQHAAKRALMRWLKLEKTLTRNAPTPQNMIDLFKGEWACGFPPPFDALKAGNVPAFQDDRIAWAIEKLGGLARKSVLELGPMEAGHTYMLERAGAARITAIEANPSAFLKCLIAKEILKFKHVEFLFGDFVEYLNSKPEPVDAVIASGVLYHMADPVGLINKLSAIAPHLYIWTHYYEHSRVTALPALAKQFVSKQAVAVGFKHVLHRREYTPALRIGKFFGGTEAYSNWLELDSILGALKHAGFAHIDLQFDDPAHVNGPCVSLIASKQR